MAAKSKTGKTDKKTTLHEYTVMFEPVPEGGYNVVVPAIPEICTFGATFGEAKRMASDAIHCYLESVAKLRVANITDDGSVSE